MEIIVEKIQREWQGVELKGEIEIINGRTTMVRMTAPCKGLSWGEHYNFSDAREYDAEQHISRGTYHLVQLYEQFKEVVHNYTKCKQLMDEWTEYCKPISRLIDEANEKRKSEDLSDLEKLSLTFYIDALKADKRNRYEELVAKYDAPKLPSYIMKASLMNIDKPRKQ